MVEPARNQAPSSAADMGGEALDENTQQTLDFINQMGEDQEQEQLRSASEVSGLKVTTFGALHRESEAKKFVSKLPKLNTVLEQVKFELQELPDDL